jgi:hypothetical protein
VSACKGQDKPRVAQPGTIHCWPGEVVQMEGEKRLGGPWSGLMLKFDLQNTIK